MYDLSIDFYFFDHAIFSRPNQEELKEKNVMEEFCWNNSCNRHSA